jgi:hypothetical protein
MSFESIKSLVSANMYFIMTVCYYLSSNVLVSANIYLIVTICYYVSSNAFILFQEGRMRGQAFVTFPTVELAQRALVSDVTYSVL